MNAVYTILLLISSNIFMTLAWYGHLKLQEMKRDLADTVVTEGTGALSSITREDLIRMLDEDL